MEEESVMAELREKLEKPKIGGFGAEEGFRREPAKIEPGIKGEITGVEKGVKTVKYAKKTTRKRGPRKKETLPSLMEEESVMAELREKLEKPKIEGFGVDEELEEFRREFAKIEPSIEGEITGIEEEVKIGKYNSKKFGPLLSFSGMEGHEEVERYWIEKPFAFATILVNNETNEYLYHLVEPELTPAEREVLKKVQDDLRVRLPYDRVVEKKDEVLTEKFSDILKEHGITDQAIIHRMLYCLKRDSIGYYKIDPLLKDGFIEDISCDGADVPIFLYHRKYYNIKTDIKFSREELDQFIVRLAERCGKHISLAKPLIEATLPDGSRVQLTLGSEVTTKGSSFSIRKFLGKAFTPVDLIRFNTFSLEMLAYLWLAIENRKSALIIGGTASGKTSTLNALAFFVPPSAKIVTIEDTRELSLYQENWLPSLTREAPGEAKIDMYDLLRQALRQRPECMIVGEVRGVEALTMFQAMSTGHAVYSTMHAGNLQEAINRLKGEPINLPHAMLASLDIVCTQVLTYVGRERVRRSESVIEIVGVDPVSGETTINRLFEWDPATDSFRKIGESHVLMEIMSERGWSSNRASSEIENREKILRYMVENNITQPKDVATLINMYYYNPNKVFKMIS
jgi:flagellar protein FlaI